MSDIVDGQHGGRFVVSDGSIAAGDATSADPADALADGAGGQGVEAAGAAAPGTEVSDDKIAGEARQAVPPPGGTALDSMVTHSMVCLVLLHVCNSIAVPCLKIQSVLHRSFSNRLTPVALPVGHRNRFSSC